MYNRVMIIHAYATLLLILGALGSTGFYLWQEYTGGNHQARPYLQPLTIAIIGLIALIVPVPISLYYKAAVLLGLLLTLLGSAFRLLPGMPLVVNKAYWLLAAAVFMTAFAALHPVKLPTPWLLLLLLYAGGIAWLLAPRVAELQVSLLVYGFVLLLMTWQSLEVLVVVGQWWALLPFLGALCLVIADSIQGLDRFYRALPATRLLMPAFLLLGQLLLALSIWGPALGMAFS
ncbi:MAG: lysoplasmalogenase family protein [Caldilineaceae bacterium]